MPDGHDRPRGLPSQAKATFAAGRRLVLAHVALGKAELGAIAAEAKRVAALAGGALGLLLFAALFLPVGLTLFVGEWLFGSLGWGVLHGTEASVAIAIVLVLAALDIRPDFLGRMLAVAAVVGVVVAVVFGLAMSNALWTRVGEAVAPGLDQATRPLAVAVVAMALVGAVLGLAAAARSAGPGGRLSAAGPGVVFGAALGALVGAFSAISFTPEVGAAIGLAVGLAAWPALALTALTTFDVESLKRRFYPATTIETTQETIGWLQQIRDRTRRGWKS